MMSIQAKAIAAAIVAAILFGSGWQVRSWYDGAQDAARLEAEARATSLMNVLANKVSASTETAIQGIRIENRTIYNQAQKEIVRETVYAACRVPDAGLLLVNAARASTAASKPDDRLPSARAAGP